MNIPEKFWQMAKYLVAILIIFFILLSIKELKSIDYVGVNTNTTNTITVNGSGDIVAKPDIAIFSFSVTENSKTISDAQDKASVKINAAQKAMKDAGIAENDIQTTSYSINPHYEYQSVLCTTYNCPPAKSVLSGYDVSQSVQIKVKDLTKVGDLVTSVGSLGVQNVSGLSFSVDKPESVQAEARAKAIADAQERAKVLAKSLGVSLVRITSFYESNNNPVVMKYAMGVSDSVSSASAPRAPEITPGEQKIVSNVTITYEIK